MSLFERNYPQVGLCAQMIFLRHTVRFIAEDSGVTGANNRDNDFTPSLNILNEFYVKDSSKISQHP